MLKYPWMRGTAGKKYRKWGAYQSEEKEFEFARALNAVGDESKSLEAALMDWADDITYSVHDLEDFYRARLIPLHILVSDKNERKRFYEATADRLKDQESMTDADFDHHIKTFDPFLDSVPLSESYKGTQDQRSALRTFTAGLIGRYVKASTLIEQSSSIKLNISQGYKREVKMLKQLTWHYVIDNPALATQQYGQRRMIKDLFSIYREIASKEEYWHVLPASSREEVESVTAEVSNSRDRERALTRIIVDLIAGMTEKHAADMHRRLTGVSLGSALEHIGRY
jgi:dGTPase